MSMELILKDVQVTIPQQIENLEQLKAELEPKLEYYNNLAVTDDGIKEAKSDRAKLNKLKAAIEGRRKEVKKQVMGIYEPLEKQCKELTTLIDKPINAIDKQIKAFDEIKKQEKYKELEEFFDEVNTLDFVKFEDVLSPKWSNATMKTDTLKNEISGNVQTIVDDYSEIKNLYENSAVFTAIEQHFKETKDKAHTLAYAVVLEKQEQARQEEKAKVEQLKAEKQAALEQENIKITEPIVQKAEPINEPILTGEFKVFCTKNQLIALRDFMKNNGINFEVLK